MYFFQSQPTCPSHTSWPQSAQCAVVSRCGTGEGYEGLVEDPRSCEGASVEPRASSTPARSGRWILAQLKRSGFSKFVQNLLAAGAQKLLAGAKTKNSSNVKFAPTRNADVCYLACGHALVCETLRHSTPCSTQSLVSELVKSKNNEIALKGTPECRTVRDPPCFSNTMVHLWVEFLPNLLQAVGRSFDDGSTKSKL